MLQPQISDPDSQLIDGCLHCMRQCERLLQSLSDENYTHTGLGSSVGAHMRHVLERFQSLFDGLQGDVIDYDARKRDRDIERDRHAALSVLADLVRGISGLGSDIHRRVRVQESVNHQGPAVTIHSSVSRELMSLITHTTHHLAIIVLLVKPFGVTMGPEFGKAASTIRFENGSKIPA